jgi:hypothetical protein
MCLILGKNFLLIRDSQRLIFPRKAFERKNPNIGQDKLRKRVQTKPCILDGCFWWYLARIGRKLGILGDSWVDGDMDVSVRLFWIFVLKYTINWRTKPGRGRKTI